MQLTATHSVPPGFQYRLYFPTHPVAEQQFQEAAAFIQQLVSYTLAIQTAVVLPFVSALCIPVCGCVSVMAFSPGRTMFFLGLSLVLLGGLRCCSCSQVCFGTISTPPIPMHATALLDHLQDTVVNSTSLHELPHFFLEVFQCCNPFPNGCQLQVYVVYMGKGPQGDSDRRHDILRLHHQMLTAVHDGRSITDSFSFLGCPYPSSFPVLLHTVS